MPYLRAFQVSLFQTPGWLCLNLLLLDWGGGCLYNPGLDPHHHACWPKGGKPRGSAPLLMQGTSLCPHQDAGMVPEPRCPRSPGCPRWGEEVCGESGALCRPPPPAPCLRLSLTLTVPPRLREERYPALNDRLPHFQQLRLGEPGAGRRLICSGRILTYEDDRVVTEVWDVERRLYFLRFPEERRHTVPIRAT